MGCFGGQNNDAHLAVDETIGHVELSPVGLLNRTCELAAIITVSHTKPFTNWS